MPKMEDEAVRVLRQENVELDSKMKEIKQENIELKEKINNLAV